MSFMRQGPTAMLKDGATMVDEPVVKNIQACRQMSKITSSSMGPFGLCKMVINHLNKLFVTHDASTILSELEVEHPAAKLLVMASKAMQEEVGDGTNFVITFAGELLSQAESLVKMGLHPSEIITGYVKSSEKALSILDSCVVSKVDDVCKLESVLPAIRTAIGSKLYGYQDFLGTLVAKACINSCPSNHKSFNVDNVRVAKLDGDGVYASELVMGAVVTRGVEGTIKHMKDVKIVVFSCAVDVPSTETKGTVLIETAEQLMSYSRKEEDLMEEVVKGLAAAKVNCVISNSNFGDLALHFLERYNMMAMKIPSKFELRRLCAAIGARSLAQMASPTLEDIGQCDNVDQKEMGGKKIVVFSQSKDDSQLSTIVVRGATQSVLDDVERAIDDGINVFKCLTKDAQLVAGAGAFEMQMQKQLMTYAEQTPGLDQYAMRKFATSFEVIPRTLTEVSGYNGTNIVTQLVADHQAGKKNHGLNCDEGCTHDAVIAGIVDPLHLKFWGIKLATDVAVTVLQVDQIIVAKQAGGPKVRPDQARDAE